MLIPHTCKGASFVVGITPLELGSPIYLEVLDTAIEIELLPLGSLTKHKVPIQRNVHVGVCIVGLSYY